MKKQLRALGDFWREEYGRWVGMTAIAFLVLVVLSLLRGFAASAAGIIPATNADFDVPCAAAILIDEDSGTVLYEKNADARRPIASITKVMTLLLAFEALEAGKIHLDDFVPVSEHAYHMGGSQIWLEPGEQMTLDDMLKAICISSANDAAVAVAEYVGGSETAFAEMMNVRAYELGMANTHFVNACGLDEAGHLSTARDVALMSREMLLHHTEVRDYCSIWMDTLRGGATQLVNTNKLVRFYPGATGLKTGSTDSAKYCISATAEKDGMELIAVILGGSTSDKRFSDAKALLNYGFAAYSLVTVTPESPLPAVPVTLGTQKTVQSVLTSENALLLEKSRANGLTQAVSLPESIDAPVEEGEPLGTLDIFDADGTPVASLPLLAGESIPHLTWSELFCRLLKLAYCGA